MCEKIINKVRIVLNKGAILFQFIEYRFENAFEKREY